MDELAFTKLLFHRSLAFLYFCAFLSTWNQFLPLCGQNGLLPLKNFFPKSRFRLSPSIFWFKSNDRFLQCCSFLGIVLSLIALLGISDAFGFLPSIFCWFMLWLLYLSFVNVGQVFFSFGWESMLLEAGFLTIFLGPDTYETPYILMIFYQWILFRNMFGAGMIKLRCDSCWKDLSCLFYHFETQPIPNPLSWIFHKLPKPILKGGVLANHFIEVIVPFFYFFPAPFSYYAALLTILFQLTLIISGNFSWLNYLTIVLCIPCFDDHFFRLFFNISTPSLSSAPAIYWGVLSVLACFLLYLSWRPAKNLLSKRQVMNRSFEPLHILNTYGAFGAITKKRYEIVIEGSENESLLEEVIWKEYEFKAKPTKLTTLPPIVAPYHLRLDWLMWFAAMGEYPNHPWILHLIHKLLLNDSGALSLIKHNPFSSSPPKFIRLQLYHYRFTNWKERKEGFWKREFVCAYTPPLHLKHEGFRDILQNFHWLP